MAAPWWDCLHATNARTVNRQRFGRSEAPWLDEANGRVREDAATGDHGVLRRVAAECNLLVDP